MILKNKEIENEISSEELCNVTCNSCGIEFFFSKKIEKLWRDSHKTCFCPNGHSLAWSEKTEDAKNKELTELHSEVKCLKEKLNESKKKVAELILEIRDMESFH